MDSKLIRGQGTATGTNTYAVDLSPLLDAYRIGHYYYVEFTNANTGASTLNINGLGAKSIKHEGNELGTGEILAGSILLLKYDGTDLRVISSSSISLSTGTKGKIILYKSGADGVQYSTFASANASAVAGDTVVVHAGIYDENDIAKDGVYYLFMPGAVVDYTGVDTTAVIKTGGFGGSSKWYILGNGTFKSLNSPVLEGLDGVSGADTLVFEADLVHQKGTKWALHTRGVVNAFMNVKHVIADGVNSIAAVIIRGTNTSYKFGIIENNTATANIYALASDVGTLHNVDIDYIKSTQRGVLFGSATVVNLNVKNAESVGDCYHVGSAAQKINLEFDRSISSAGRLFGYTVGSGDWDITVNGFGQADITAPFNFSNGTRRIRGRLTSSGVGGVGGGITTGNNLDLYFDGILEASGGTAVYDAGSNSNIYFKGRIEHSHTSSAVSVLQPTTDFNLLPGSIIIAGGTNSILTAVGNEIKIGVGCVSNKPVHANAVEVGATLTIDSNYS